ncbi:TPA: divalent-cation tolerance protein CutA [Photobacterium damselae]
MANNVHEFCVVMTTYANENVGKQLIHALIEKRLAACIQSKQVESHYHWQGKVCCDIETQLMIKTKTALFDQVEAEIKAIHYYETPEIIALPITAGSQDYLDWISTECKKID